MIYLLLTKKMAQDLIRFGTGGIPLTTKNRNTKEGILRLEELGLQHMELEFVYSVFLKEADAPEVKEFAQQHDVTMSVHGSYYTNFASGEAQKRAASMQRLEKAARVGSMAGAKSITFHAGFYTGQDKQVVFDNIVAELQKAGEQLTGCEIVIAPELTGKGSQFGDLEELIALIKRLDDPKKQPRFAFCIDFAHNHARQNGAFAEEADFKQMFDTIGQKLGESYLQNLHMHMSAIEFSAKGERNHLTFLDSFAAYKDHGIDLPDMEPHYAELVTKNRLGGGKQDWRALLKVLKEYKVGGYMVCESPNLEHDSLLMQKFYREL